MSGQIFLNLLNELLKKDKMRYFAEYLVSFFFLNEFNKFKNI